MEEASVGGTSNTETWLEAQFLTALKALRYIGFIKSNPRNANQVIKVSFSY